MKGVSNAKLIFVQPSLHKQGSSSGISSSLASFGSNHRLCLVAIISFFTFASLFTLLTTTPRDPKPLNINTHLSFSSSSSAVASPLPGNIYDALLHYATSSGTNGRMADADLRAIASVIRRRFPCNLLVFGIGFETLLWRSLNHGGRTVFLDENEYYIKHFEDRHPGLEAYDVSYVTKVSELPELLAAAKEQIKGDCRPVQNLLFSDCRLGINDLPNQLYDVAWDVILVDGPRGYSPSSPGRMSAIFTAAVMARSAGKGKTDVLVHDFDREVERVCSEEFLCAENLVGSEGLLAHFVIHGGDAARRDDFCVNRTVTLPPVAKAL